jgi:hypothetical protein
MPHFGLMEEKKLGPVQGPFQRARLHLRGGKRRLRQGKVSDGIVTLYDALTAAMESFAASDKGNKVVTRESARNEKQLFCSLVQAGLLDGSFDFFSFDRLAEKALFRDLSGYDYRPLLAQIEELMEQLGVMPFDEAQLPPEDPETP